MYKNTQNREIIEKSLDIAQAMHALLKKRHRLLDLSRSTQNTLLRTTLLDKAENLSLGYLASEPEDTNFYEQDQRELLTPDIYTKNQCSFATKIFNEHMKDYQPFNISVYDCFETGENHRLSGFSLESMFLGISFTEAQFYKHAPSVVILITEQDIGKSTRYFKELYDAEACIIHRD
ncbi:MAG: hypothetical protein ACMXYK_03105 [Candidatus Woesearchaeota archaeon]